MHPFERQAMVRAVQRIEQLETLTMLGCQLLGWAEGRVVYTVMLGKPCAS
jgi:hypothetical protein